MIETAKKVRRYFENAEIDLPGFPGFPINACQGASLFLGVALKELFPQIEVNYVIGSDINSEVHYWLEVNGLVYDITADQFPGISSPLYSSNYQPLQGQFSYVEKQSIEQALHTYDVTTETYKNTLKIDLRFHLTGKI